MTRSLPLLLFFTVCLFLSSCGNPDDWPENTLGRNESKSLLHEADQLRHRAKRAVLRPNTGRLKISQNENPYAKCPILVFLEVPKSKYDDRTKLEYHSVNSRLPTDMVPDSGDAVATFVIADSYRKAGRKTKSTVYGKEVLDLFDYHDMTRLKLIDRETGRYTKTSIRSSDDESIAFFLSSLPGEPPHPNRISDYFELREESTTLRREFSRKKP